MLNKLVLENPMLSLWLKDGIGVELTPLTENEQTDVLIVGAGITGITAAYLLTKQNIDVMLIDKRTPLSLASGNTTAKFTFQHSLIYHQIMDNDGADQAILYYKAQMEGMRLVKDIIQENNIECDFKQTYACVYAKDQSEIETLKEEQKAYENMNVQSDLIYEDPHNLGYKAALKVDDQFELNPVKYLRFMLRYLLEHNVRIYKDTMAVDIKSKGPYTVETKDRYNIEANSVIVASGYPFFDANSMYFARLEPFRSYLTAYGTKNTQSNEGMFISMEEAAPYSIRFSDTDGQRYLLVGGQGHKVGQKESEMADYESLLHFAFTHFNVEQVAYRWSAQDYKSVDLIPYIGRLSSDYENVYIATGYNKWGMTNGSFAADLITSMIKEKEVTREETITQDDKSSYTELFNPSRGEIPSNMGSFLKANLNVAKEMVKSKFGSSDIELSELEPNQGAVMRIAGKKVAAFRDENGEVYTHSKVCPHMGCDLEYNDAEKSFDCPCHGSRFSARGIVIEGPALKDLEEEDI